MLLSADQITCCSQALKNIIVKEFPINSCDILVTPNPANIINFYYDKNIKKQNKLVFVGSLEERKGVCVLAQALNIVFQKYPDLKIDFIGKDTNRNSKNISTKQLIIDTVNKKENINFTDQLSNYELNNYLNSSRVGIFPSLFDNFPYVILEAMTTGLHIVGSKNSGMVEMLNDDTSIYKTGDVNSLANKIIEKYELSLKQEINTNNIERVKKEYNATKICKELLEIYNETIKKFNGNKISKQELNDVLKNIKNEEIISYRKQKVGVANKVYKVVTKNNKYIIKKYLYDYDFLLAQQLYKLYTQYGIDNISPLNNQLIFNNNFNYNVFEYKKHKKVNISIEQLKNIICCNRECNGSNSIVDKCNKYYDYLKSLNYSEYKLQKSEIIEVLNTYEKIKDNKIINEKFINHGDISKQNIIDSNNKKYLIDFDETCIAPRLYDFAVIVIKMFVKNNKINIKKYNQLKQMISKEFKQYNDEDYQIIVKYYLTKILLEKYYFHQKNKIDLFSKEQLRDDYRKYLELLRGDLIEFTK